jgi:hypothetical protein
VDGVEGAAGGVEGAAGGTAAGAAVDAGGVVGDATGAELGGTWDVGLVGGWVEVVGATVTDTPGVAPGAVGLVLSGAVGAVLSGAVGAVLSGAVGAVLPDAVGAVVEVGLTATKADGTARSGPSSTIGPVAASVVDGAEPPVPMVGRAPVTCVVARVITDTAQATVSTVRGLIRRQRGERPSVRTA